MDIELSCFSIMDLRVGSLPEWDSLGHFNLLLFIEENYGVRFSMEEMSEMKSLKDIASVLTVLHFLNYVDNLLMKKILVFGSVVIVEKKNLTDLIKNYLNL